MSKFGEDPSKPWVIESGSEVEAHRATFVIDNRFACVIESIPPRCIKIWCSRDEISDEEHSRVLDWIAETVTMMRNL